MAQRQRLPNPLKILKSSQSGVALLMAVVTLSLLIFIALEVQYDTTVDYVVSRQQVDRVRAYYAAKSGIELSLLRIMVYKQAVAAMGKAVGGNLSMLDPIWQFPFMWPPTLAIPGSNVTEVEKSQLNDTVKESIMDTQYTTSISPEGGHIDINDLGSDIKGFKKLMKDQVLRIFKSQLEQDESFRHKYAGYNFDELVNNISDYIDEDSEGQNGGDESAGYRDVNDPELKMPPNRPLRTLDELHQVAGMTDDFYNLLASRVTVFGTKGVNINYASKEVLMALDPSMKSELVDKAIERRSNPKIGGPFKDDGDFFAFIGPLGADVKAMKEAKMPLLYDVEFNFRVVSTGFSSNVKRVITVVTYDYPNLAQRLITILDKQAEQDKGPGATPSPTTSTRTTPPTSDNQKDPQPDDGTKKQTIQSAKGRPTVVYWEEN